MKYTVEKNNNKYIVIKKIGESMINFNIRVNTIRNDEPKNEQELSDSVKTSHSIFYKKNMKCKY